MSPRVADDDELASLLAAARDPDRPAEERVRAGVDLVRALAAGARGTPALVVFEDLHWADSESIAVFERLAEPPAPGAAGAGAALVLVGTYRPDGLSRRHPAAEALPRLERRHRVTHVHLDRLTPAEVSGFLAAVFEEEPSYRAVDALHTRTGGNPFFLEELVAAAGQLPVADGDAPLPWTVSELVTAELDDVAPDVRELVRAAAVLGRRVTFDLLAAVTGASEADLIARLRVAVDTGLLVEGDLDVFGFHHELAREAVESGLLGRERRRLHEAALDALRAAGSRDHVALAHHAHGAGRFDDMVDEARLGAHDSLGLGSSYQALQLAETGLAESPDDLDLLGVATRAAWLAGLLDDALAHAERWLAAARRAGDVGAEAEALALGAQGRLRAGEPRRRGRAHRRADRGPRPAAHRRAAGPGDGGGRAVVHAARPGRRHLRMGRQGAGAGRCRRRHRRPAAGDGREGVDAHARPGPDRRGPGPAAGGGRRRRARGRAPAGRPHVQQPDLARPAMERRRRGAVADRADAGPRRSGGVRLAGGHRRGGFARRAGGGRGRPRRRHRPPRLGPRRGHRTRRRGSSPGGPPSSGPAWPSRPAISTTPSGSPSGPSRRRPARRCR